MAVQFASASSEYLEVDSAVPGASAVPLTMVCWFNHPGNVVHSLMMHVDQSEVNHYFLMLIDTSENVIASHRAGASPADATAGAFSANTWQHAGAVFAAITSRTAYLNGLAGTPNITNIGTPSTIDRLSIGRFGDFTPGGYFQGSIAEAAIWDVALTSAEMLILAAGYSPLFVRRGSLVFYDPMIRLDSGDDSHDLIGGLTMTGFNTPTTSNHPRIIRPSTPYVPAFLTAAPPGLSIPVAFRYYQTMAER